MKRVVFVGVLALLASICLPPRGWAQQGDLRSVGLERLAQSRAKRERARQVALERGWMIQGVDPEGRGYSLQELAPNGMPVYFLTCNGTSATSTRTDSLYPYVGGGAGERLFLWDEGQPRLTHQEFGGRITWSDAASPPISNHSTHVAGTLINSGGFHTPNEPYRGMAYQADLTAYDWDSDLAEMIGEAAGNILLSNHSYSYVRGWYYYSAGGYWMWFGDVTVSTTEDYQFGFYDDRAHDLDSLANAAPDYLIVMAASNDRNDVGTAAPDSHVYYDPVLEDWAWSTDPRDPDGGTDGYDCLPNSGQVAKNVLTIGAADCTYFLPPTYDPQYIDMTSYSSWGPTDDGRIKPDLVGDGDHVWSSWGTGDAAYQWQSGTSQAAPNITGSLALLQKAYRDCHGGTPMRAATLKALVIDTAVDVEAEGPDYEFGWGLPNFDAAHDLIVADDETGGLINEHTLSQGDTMYFYFCRPYAGLDKAVFTLCWSDPEATPPAPSLDPTDPMLVNDLDMRVYYDGLEHRPWTLDPSNPANAATAGDNVRDNVERVDFVLGDVGNFIVRITHKGTLSGGSQDFSLIASQVRRTRSYHVYADGSGDFPDIATAANGTECGDTVYVHAGTYYEHDIIFNEGQTVIGVDGAESTIINAQDLGRCLYLAGDVKAYGLTLMNGTKTGTEMDGRGAGIYCSGRPEIHDCIVKENVANQGGGIYSLHGAKVHDCIIRENTAWDEGGGVYFNNFYYPELVGCLVDGNVSDEEGGGVYAPNAYLTVFGSTIVSNISVAGGAGLHCDGNKAEIDNSIVAFNMSLSTGVGVYTDASTIDIACCDVYGNNAGNYGGGIGDQTGSNDNISADPQFCDAGADDYSLQGSSPCAPYQSPCGQLIGVYGVGCLFASELVIQNVAFTETDPGAGDAIYATIEVKNTGPNPAGSFYIDYYQDRTSPPSPGATGDQRHLVAGLASGDSVEWTTGPITNDCFGDWDSYFQVDTDNSVLETNESNNVSGPHAIGWRIPVMAGWPAAGSVDFLGSPAIAPLDDDPFSLEVIVGDAGGFLHAIDHAGVPLSGWPVDVGDSLISSPAVGDITGDYHMEVVVGCVDGYLYAFDYEGTQLWSYNAGDPMRTTPALADLDDDGKLEVVFANTSGKSGGYVHVLEGGGSAFAGSWPFNIGDPHVTSPAVGDVDVSGDLEIAVVSYGMDKPTIHSDVYLLQHDGTLFSVSWPATIDTVVSASPVMGNIAGTAGSSLEIVVGARSGVVYALNSSGAAWPSPPRVPGAIERSPALVNSDKEPLQEILVSSRYWNGTFPPAGRWVASVTLIDNTGSIVSGWPRSAGSGAIGRPLPSPVAIHGKILATSPYGDFYAWTNTGTTAEGFPHDITGILSSSAAVGDLDGDGQLDVVGASSADSIYCLDVGCSGDYAAALDSEWPMFRNDRTRCGCYSVDTPTGAGDDAVVVPSVTALRSIRPNPFNPTAIITYEVPARSQVHLAVYDVAGRRVAVLVDEVVDAGPHEVAWHGTSDDGRVAVSGVYFCCLRANGVVETKKMVLLK